MTFFERPYVLSGLPFRANTACVRTSRHAVSDPAAESPSTMKIAQSSAPSALSPRCLTAFPGGLQPIVDAGAARGVRLGLWIPFAAIGEKTADYRPEWVTLDQEGRPKTTGTMAGQKAVMCMATGYRDRAAARICDAIERFKLAYVKLDLTTIFNAYGEAPGCWAKGHDHGNWAESLNLIYEGISYVTAKVYEKHPEVLLDLTD